MFRIRPLIKKRNGICPICALPYVREKRTLRAAYFDHAYDITAWILRCEECGYEVVLPGIARINRHKDSRAGTGPHGTGGLLLLATAATPTEAALPAEASGKPGSPGQPELQGCPEDSMAGDAVDPTDAVDDGRPGSHGNADSPHSLGDLGQERAAGTPGTAAGTEAKGIPEAPEAPKAPEAAKKAIEDAREAPRENAGDDGSKDAGKDGDKGGRESAKDGGDLKAVPEEGPKTDAGAGHPALAGGEEAKPDAVNPANPAPPAEPEGKAAGQAKEKAAGAQQKEGKAKDKNAGQETSRRDKKAQGGKEPAKRQPGQEPSVKQDKAGGQKKTAEAGIRKPDAPSQPVPKGSQPPPRPGFAGSGMFPPSALSNLALLQASVHADAAKGQADAGKEGQPEEPGKQAGGGHAGRDPFADSQNLKKLPTQASKPLPIQKTLSAEPEGDQDGTAGRKTAGAGDGDKAGPPADTKKPMKLAGPVKPKVPAGTEKAREAGEPKEAEGAAKAQETKKAQETGREDSPEPGKAPGKDMEDQAADTGRDSGAAAEDPAAKGCTGEEPAGESKTKDAKEAGRDKGAKGDKEEYQKGKERKDLKVQAMEATRKISGKLPQDLAEKIPVLSQISRQQRHALSISEEKRFLEQHIPSKQVIINDLVYDTDSSEMFLRADGRHGSTSRACITTTGQRTGTSSDVL